MSRAQPVVPKGMWWCNTHRREATHVKANGDHCCNPAFGGITMPCFSVFAEMTIRKTRRPSRAKGK